MLNNPTTPFKNSEQEKVTIKDQPQNTPITHSVMRDNATRYYDNINHLESIGYTQLVQRPYTEQLSQLNVKLSQDYDAMQSLTDVAMFDRCSRRLFSKSGILYQLSFKSLTTQTHPIPELLAATDDYHRPLEVINYVYVIIAKTKANGAHVFELRVLPNRDNAHAYLFNANKSSEHTEKASTLVAAGTFSVTDSQIFFATDQTGHFYEYLKPAKDEYRKIFETFFPTDLGYTYFHLPTLPDVNKSEASRVYAAMVTSEREKALRHFSPVNCLSSKQSLSSDSFMSHSDEKNIAPSLKSTRSTEMIVTHSIFASPANELKAQKNDEAQHALYGHHVDKVFATNRNNTPQNR